MGCSESKNNSVATGNTVTRKKLSNAVDVEPEQSLKTQEVESVKEANNEDNKTSDTNLLVQKQEQEKQENHVKSENSIGESNVDEEVVVDDYSLKETNENRNIENDEERIEIKEGDYDNDDNAGAEEVEDALKEGETERLITKESPNRFFSSSKEHEDFDGTSEYNSPRHEPFKDGSFDGSMDLDVLALEAKQQEDTQHEVVKTVMKAGLVEEAKSTEAEVAGSTIEKDNNVQEITGPSS